MTQNTIWARHLSATLFLGTAALLPFEVAAQSRVERATDNCLEMLESDYGIEQKSVDRINARDNDNILIHVNVVLPDGTDEYLRCRVERRGTDIRQVRVFTPGFDAGGRHPNWAPADRLLLRNRATAEAPDPTPAPSLAPATPKIVGAGRTEIERTGGARTGVGRIGAAPEDSGEASSGPRTYSVK